MNKLVLSNLVHRPLRSLISIVAIGIEVTLILVIVGLSVGMLNDAAERQRGIGADIMIQPPGSSFISTISGAPVSIKLADVLRKQPHVAMVSPVITQLTTGGTLEAITGVDLNTYPLGHPLKYLAGGPFQNPDDVIVDDVWARSHNARVGDRVDVLNHQARICGIVEHGVGGRRLLRLDTLQDWIGAPGKATIFYVKADDPGNTNLIVDELRKLPGMEGYQIRSIADYMTMMTTENLPGLSIFLNVVIGIAVIIGFIVIFQAMYTAVMERTREIGILKSLGASKVYIVNVVLRETVLLAICGVAVGIGISFATRGALEARFPTLPIEIGARWLVRAAGIAVVGALLGAVYPAYKAARKDPIDALAYE
ncbi:MAG TPA: FtsX-like permease family protein [Terriglobales bacterium]|nr:FtsX-like permease family protein [Terriglobales bacterium]